MIKFKHHVEITRILIYETEIVGIFSKTSISALEVHRLNITYLKNGLHQRNFTVIPYSATNNGLPSDLVSKVT
jgi:hypothetical protein